MQSSSPPGSARRRPRGRRFVLLRLVLILVFAFIVIDVVPIPWALRIGGRFTPLESWDGYGAVRASNGGRYVLFTHLQAGIYHNGSNDCSFRGCDSLQGSAKLCTENGQTYSFALSGAVHSWLSTNGARTSVDLTGGTPKPLPEGWVVAFAGAWHGPVLRVSSPDNSFTKVFTPRGAIRTTTSTADSGTAAVALSFGSAAGFDQACRALAGGSGG